MAYAILFPAVLAPIFLIACVSLKAAPGPPYVSEDMQNPGFWIGRLPAPKTLIMTPDAIGRLNLEIRKRGFRVRPTYEHHRIPGRNTVRILKEQMEGLTHWKKYNRENHRLRDPGFYGRMGALVAIEEVPDVIKVKYGLTVKRTSVRLMPTDMLLQRRPKEPQFDILQSSVLDIGQPVALYHLSRDREWGAVQTAFCFGWVRLADIALSPGKKHVDNFLASGRPVLAVANAVTVFSDSDMLVPLDHLQMGSWLPLDERIPGGYFVRIPQRRQAGELRFGRAYIQESRDTAQGFLEFTEEGVINAAFKQLGNAYGWGGTGVGTDCSKFILNVFSVFGVELPRTSFLQVRSLSVMNAPEGAVEKRKFLESLPPGRALLQFPGHIGLYLGAVGGHHYMIHSLSAYRIPGEGEDEEIKVERVLVSDLLLGQGSRKGSYFENLEKAGILR